MQEHCGTFESLLFLTYNYSQLAGEQAVHVKRLPWKWNK